MPEFQKILYEKRGRIAVITINRPESMNAIDPQTSQELYDAWCDFRDDGELWVAILTGAGDRAFSAGNDLVATARGGGPGAMRHVPFGGNTRDFVTWKPTIAAINGYCLAGGLEMALACDIRIAAEHAQFGLPEVRWAIIPGAGGTQRLPRAIPLALAMEMILTGERIDAQRALQAGLVSRVVPADQLMPTALEVAETICKRGPLAVRSAKESIMRGLDMTLQQGLDLEAMFSARVWASEDAREGPRAFAEKREPQYKGR
ncbi:MAG TPA: enoyl-CoA hydratase-related protein [Dehalococcoidia bacterium]